MNVLFDWYEGGGRLELRQLATFAEVVRQGSFVRAAERLDYAQSTVTLHVQQLEAEFGVTLVTRQGRKAELTEAGRTLHEHATSILRHLDTLHQRMADLAEGDAGHLRLGAIEPAASLRLPELLARYCAVRPKVRLRLEVGGTVSVSRQVAAGDLDFALSSPPPSELGLAFEPLFSESLALLVLTSHPLAGLPVLSAADLRAQRLLVTEPGCAYRQLTEQCLAARGLAVAADIEISSMTALQRAVQMGLGIGLVPAIAADPPPAGTALRHVEGLELGLPVGLVTRPDGWPPSRALNALLALLRTELGSEATPGTRHAV